MAIIHGSEILGTSKISKKFQITVPKSVREKFGLKESDLVIFIGDDGLLELKRAKPY